MQTAHPGDARTKKIADIQVLRAVAIVLVLIQHNSLPATAFYAAFPGATLPFWIGVDLFFVVSGFVVTQSILSRPLSPVHFLIRRAFRLLPALLCFLALSAVISAFGSLATDTFGVTRISGTPGSFFADAIGILLGVLTITGQSPRLAHGAMWTLSVEFQFYLTFAALMFAFLMLKLANFRIFALALATALWAALFIARLVGPLAENELHPLMKYLVFFRFDFLLLGVIGAAGLRPLITGRTFRRGPTIAALLLFGALALIAARAEWVPMEYKFGRLMDGILMPIVGVAFLAVVVLASVDRAFAGHDTRAYKLAVWIGEISYSLYLFHLPALALMWLVFYFAYPAAFHLNDYGVLVFAANLAVTFVMAWLVYERVERPFNRFGALLAAQVTAIRSPSTP